jgi:hypothetical protein
MTMPPFGPPAPPGPPVIITPSKDVDSARYRKTYSYFRQQDVKLGFVKGGSNAPPEDLEYYPDSSYPNSLPDDHQQVRDVTRFKKSYSSSRRQPVKIRVYQR